MRLLDVMPCCHQTWSFQRVLLRLERIGVPVRVSEASRLKERFTQKQQQSLMNNSDFLTQLDFYTIWVEVTYITSLQIAYKSNPTSAQLGQKWDFLLPTKLSGSLFFISDKLSGSWFWKFCPTWAELFFAFFIKAVLKMAFLLATTGRSFFWDYSPKRQSHRLPLGETFWKIADKARIKTLFSAATIWERLWTKYCSHRLPLERKFFCARYGYECFFCRYMKIVFQNPLINRS